MTANLNEAIEETFRDLVGSSDITLTLDEHESQIIADDWTLVLMGDPVNAAMIALDDETGEPDTTLQDVITEEELTALRDVDERLGGQVSTALRTSSDPYADALARLITN